MCQAASLTQLLHLIFTVAPNQRPVGLLWRRLTSLKLSPHSATQVGVLKCQDALVAL